MNNAKDKSGDESPHSKWPHAPEHRLAESGTYMVTASTYLKERVFSDNTRLEALHDGLLKYAKQYEWSLEAWAVFPNHYHFIAHSPAKGASNLNSFIKHFHANSGRWVNALDKLQDRKVWHNFWDTRLTYEKSYLARLNYVHQNAVKHGLVSHANQYRWCSAAWFERTASSAQINTIYRFKIDKLNIQDDFD